MAGYGAPTIIKTSPQPGTPSSSAPGWEQGTAVNPGGTRWYEGPAGAGGVRPYTERSSAGVVHVRAGSGLASPKAPAAPAGPWSPAPGSYNPLRDIEESTRKTEGTQTLNSLERQRTVAESEYGINQADIEHHGKEILANLSRSFKNLAGRQGERGNQTGTLYGGAMLQAAAMRAGNEGRSKIADEYATKQSEGRNLTNEQRLIGTQGSITEALANARENNREGLGNIGKAKEYEAIEHGLGPTLPTPAPHAAAAGPMRYLNKASGRMETAAAIKAYRRR